MHNFLQSKRLIWVFVIIAAVAIVATGIAALWYKQQSFQSGETKSSQITKKSISVEKVPENFPAGLPLETGAKVTQNYTATTATGGVQATREFETKKTLDENYKLYQDYLKKNDWQFSGGTNQPDLKVISADKGDLHITITINNNTVTKVKTVEITVTQSP